MLEPPANPARFTGAATEDATPAPGAPAVNTVADAAEPKERKARAGTKQAQLIEMLRSPDGATIAEIVALTGWQSTYADFGINRTRSAERSPAS
jgi:hypothetical protein